ncbi:MAG: hypothetical protein KY476_13865 [Planctomycetes bacterium]|nr:hypothetical protein [Planctomycetota bacterium]
MAERLAAAAVLAVLLVCSSGCGSSGRREPLLALWPPFGNGDADSPFRRPGQSAEGHAAAADAGSASAASDYEDTSGSRRFDPETEALIATELQDASPEERRQLLADFEAVDPPMIRQLLRVRRMVKQMGQQAPGRADGSFEATAQTGHGPPTPPFPPLLRGGEGAFPPLLRGGEGGSPPRGSEGGSPPLRAQSDVSSPVAMSAGHSGQRAAFAAPAPDVRGPAPGLGSLDPWRQSVIQTHAELSGVHHAVAPTYEAAIVPVADTRMASGQGSGLPVILPPIAGPGPSAGATASGEPSGTGSGLYYEQPAPPAEGNTAAWAGQRPMDAAAAPFPRPQAGYSGPAGPPTPPFPPLARGGEGGSATRGEPGLAPPTGGPGGISFPPPMAGAPPMAGGFPGAATAAIGPDGRPADLARLIASLEQQVAAMPLPPEGDIAARNDYIERHVFLRVLYLMAGRQEQALVHIPGIDSTDQQFWQQMLWAVANYFDVESMPETDERNTQTLLAVHSAAEKLQETARLTLEHVAFCKKITSFGNYEPFYPYEFSRGQPVLVYAEVKNFKSEAATDKNGQSAFRTVLKSKIEILSPSGDVHFPLEFPPTVDLCRNHRADYFHSYEFTIPRGIPYGPHVLVLTVEDQLSSKVATYRLNFTVK